MTQRQLVLGFAGLVVLAAAGGVAFGTVHDRQMGLPPATPAVLVAQTAPAAPVTRQIPTSEAEVQLSFAPVVKAVTPAVVNVYATKLSQQTQSPFASDPFFSRFFGDSPLFQSRPRASQSLGSGVIIDPSGVIVTNSHVVHGASDIRIALSGGRQYQVDLVLDDSKSDLAVLKIKDAGGKTFPALKFADSNSVQVGDLVLAVGNPFGVGQTVTSGIVSALARTGVETGNFDYFIQTDAAINPGNSGGALVDLSGDLIGINTAIFSQSGGSVGIGFAIPANMAHAVAEAGINGGVVTRPWFGARLQEVTSDIADSLKIDPPHGAIITEVAPDSPAAEAGLKAGDVIVDLDGISIDAPQGFDFRFATKELNSSSKLTYVRNGTQTVVDVKVAAAPGVSDTAQISGNTRFAGTTVAAITPPLDEEMNLPYDSKGIVVTDVSGGSPAEQMGLQKGDVILSIDGQNVRDVKTFQSTVSTRTQGWEIVIRRAGQVIQSYVNG